MNSMRILRKKTALCEKAEALKDSGDIRKAANEVVKLQAEWKKIEVCRANRVMLSGSVSRQRATISSMNVKTQFRKT